MKQDKSLEVTRKKMIEFVQMARAKNYSDMDIVDCLLTQFVFGYIQIWYAKGAKDALKMLKEWNKTKRDIYKSKRNLAKFENDRAFWIGHICFSDSLEIFINTQLRELEEK
jgi:hypothetical protein